MQKTVTLCSVKRVRQFSYATPQRRHLKTTTEQIKIAGYSSEFVLHRESGSQATKKQAS